MAVTATKNAQMNARKRSLSRLRTPLAPRLPLSPPAEANSSPSTTWWHVRARCLRIARGQRSTKLDGAACEPFHHFARRSDAHFDAPIERNAAAGMTPEEARHAALRVFGGGRAVIVALAACPCRARRDRCPAPIPTHPPPRTPANSIRPLRRPAHFATTRWSIVLHPGFSVTANEEHRELLDACRVRDTDRAAAVEEKHLRATLAAVMQQQAT